MADDSVTRLREQANDSANPRRLTCRICRKKIKDGEVRWSRVTAIGDESWTHDTCEKNQRDND